MKGLPESSSDSPRYDVMSDTLNASLQRLIWRHTQVEDGENFKPYLTAESDIRKRL